MSGLLPIAPVFNAMNFKDESNTLVSISDSGRRFSRKIDNQRWKFTVGYQNLTRAEFAPILAFITKQRGAKETFTIIPPKIKDALGSETTTISVNGIHAVGDNTIAIDGFNADSAGSLKAWDFISFASHTKVYMVVADVTPSSNAATVTIEPPLITALANDSTVTYDDVAFTVYLTGTVQTYNLGINDLYNFEFDVCEAF